MLPQGSVVPRPMKASKPTPPWETQADGILSCGPAASIAGGELNLCLHLSDKHPHSLEVTEETRPLCLSNMKGVVQ